jgi:RND family efflux transporter MFP subunit
MLTLPRDWLGEQCAMLPGALRAVLLLEGGPGASPSLAATWPASAGLPGELIAAARAALDRDQVVFAPVGEGAGPTAFRLAAPLALDAQRRGGVAVELAASEADARAALAKLGAGTAWLAVLARRELAKERLLAVLELVAGALEDQPLRGAATALATELAMRLGLTRVSIGFAVRGDVRVEAVSHSARFDERSQLLRATAAAMEEAIDQDASVVHPPHPGTAIRVTRAHEALVAQREVDSAFSVPLVAGGRPIGAITGEAPCAPDRAVIELCEDAAALLGPILELRRQREAGWLERGGEWLRARLREEPRLRLALVAAAGVLVLLPGVVHTQHRVRADATLEGLVQRAVAAQSDGFIAEAAARAGDVVQRGQLLARLDARDLDLERQRWSARRDQLRREYRGARAGHDRSQAAILAARIAEADAQLRLLDEQLERTRLLAPFDGIVAVGDLHERLGSPVEKGQTLFEVASLDGYRIVLEVDERDIAYVEPGDSGRLVLSALPGRVLAIRIERITPVAVAADGRNSFRVEATLVGAAPPLRPGMQGIAKLDAGERRLAWIWTHGLVDWLRLRLWSWTL